MDDRSEEQSYAEISRSMNQPLRDREATNLSRIVRNVAHCRLKRTELESTRSICRWIGSKLALYELAFTVAIAGWLPMRRNANSHTASRLAVRMHTDTDAPYKLAPRYPLLLTSPLLSSPLLSSRLSRLVSILRIASRRVMSYVVSCCPFCKYELMLSKIRNARNLTWNKQLAYFV